MSNVIRLTFARPGGALELIAVPPCPHERCGWFMPELSCPVHGNYGMTFLFVRRGPVTWVRAVLGIPREPLPDEATSEDAQLICSEVREAITSALAGKEAGDGH